MVVRSRYRCGGLPHDFSVLPITEAPISILENIASQFEQTTSWEWFAFVSGVFQVVLARYNRKENFIAGIVSTLLYIYVFYQYKLFAESALNSYYLLISIAGLFYWKETQQPIAHWNTKEKVISTGIFIFGGGLLYFILKNYTSSTVPFPDALVSSIAWAGSWLLLKRKVENWVVLNISNVLAIPLLLYKGLSLTALLTLIYIYVAILGYQAWKKEIH